MLEINESSANEESIHGAIFHLQRAAAIFDDLGQDDYGRHNDAYGVPREAVSNLATLLRRGDQETADEACLALIKVSRPVVIAPRYR